MKHLVQQALVAVALCVAVLLQQAFIADALLTSQRTLAGVNANLNLQTQSQSSESESESQTESESESSEEGEDLEDGQSSSEGVEVENESSETESNNDGVADVSLSDLVKDAADPEPPAPQSQKFMKPTPKAPPTMKTVAAKAAAPAHKGLAAVQVATTSKKATGFNKELDDLEKSVLKLAKTAKSSGREGLGGFIDEINQILGAKMKGFLWEEHHATKTRLQAAYDAVKNECKVPNNGREPSLDDYNVEEQQASLARCRTKEKQKMDMREVIESLRNATEQLTAEYCSYHEANETASSALDGEKQCATDDYDSNDDVRQYLQDQYNFWEAQWKVSKFARERCEGAKSRYNQTVVNWTSANEIVLDQTRTCNATAVILDGVNCRLKEDWRYACSTTGVYRTCWDAKKREYTLVNDQAKQVTQPELQGQMAVIQRISCLLTVYDGDKDKITEGIQACSRQTYTEHPEVKNLTFPSYPTILPGVICGPEPTWPGDCPSK
eukprot:TRINITY_DN41446_c0_g1_i1.p1 TRINITY_DN41446_c0_g1~~TRINITY_DN41446_c0_g1_i1.p1  ORF type:complete len:497 (-),score=130.33 TRINITY_DN41446_c0_g1_i1:188-1678(-)